MPWIERTKMRERLLFISRLEAGDSMSRVCREFGVSRTTGYKVWRRYQDEGLSGLNDLSRRPYSNPRQTKGAIVDLLLKLKEEKPHWGSLKIRELVRRRYPELKLPARSTIDAIFTKHDLVKKRRRGRRLLKAKPTELRPATGPNDLWCIDFKGQFRLKDASLCFPLTITDSFSRYIIGCEALQGTKGGPVIDAFEQIFREYGLPSRIRSDNGSPFASRGALGLTKLSVWFLRLGINLERITPGNPQQNGQHERMHRTLKLEAIRPAEPDILRQQDRFEKFRAEFNTERPHQAIGLKTPSELYRISPRRYVTPMADLEYPGHEEVRRVDVEGRVHISGSGANRRRFKVGKALHGELVGLKSAGDCIWEVDFMDYTMGIYDEKDNIYTNLA